MRALVRSLPLLILSFAALASLPEACAQTSVATNPVGYNMFALPAGSSLRVNTFVQPTAYQGVAASYTSASNSVVTVSSSGSALTSGSYNETASGPAYYMEVLSSGSAQGLIVDVLSNTANTITVNANLSTFAVSGTTSFCIRPHTTLATLFPSNCGLTANVDALKLFFPNNTNELFTFTASGWINSQGSAGSQIIYPGQGFLLIVQTAESVTVTGCVKPGPTIVPLYAGAINMVGTINPMLSGSQTLSNYDFPAVFAPNVDAAKLFYDNGTLATEGVYESNSTNMFNGSGDADSVTVNPSDALLVTVQQNKYWYMPSFYTSGN